MYLTARRKDGSIWLHALDLATGHPKSGTPGAVRIKVNPSDTDGVNFREGGELQRTGLLLQDGAIYLGFGALNCDDNDHPLDWHGWVLAYRIPDLQQVAAYVTTPSHGAFGGGVWQSGNGLVGDGVGNIYFATGNGSADEQNRDFSESFIRLHAGSPPFYGLMLDKTPYTVTNAATLTAGDADLSAGGPVLLPGNRIAGGGKQGKLYVLDAGTMMPSQQGVPDTGDPKHARDDAEGSDGFQAFQNSWHNNGSDVECTDDRLITTRHCFVSHPRYARSELAGPNIHGGPLYWDVANPAFGLLYGMPEKDFLRSFRYSHSTHQLDASPFAVSSVRSPDGMPGSHLSLSANGSSGGIVWASVPKSDGQWINGPGSLVAFDAITLKEIWRDDDNVAFAKFNSPTVAGGKVFRPTFANKVIVYGLRSTPATTPCYSIEQKYQNYAYENGLLGDDTSKVDQVAADRVGRFRTYARGNEPIITPVSDTRNQPNGAIYWTPSTCAHEVHGAIYHKWSALGLEKGRLGYPTTDETVTPDGLGRFNHFQRGSIYWSPLTGAHEVGGAIRDRWASLGWERGTLGYPISDATNDVDGSGAFSLFEHGVIHWNRVSNAVRVSSNPGIVVSPARSGIDRLGSDIAHFNLPEPNPVMCQQSCAENAACRSWTYVNPGERGPQARCFLKSTVPVERLDGCCTSGIKVDVHPANMNPPDGNMDRTGSDFISFTLPNSDYRLCQGECALNPICRAWAYVETALTAPGVEEPKVPPAPICFLKNAAPSETLIPNTAIISGAKK
jgi:hypothetical protein